MEILFEEEDLEPSQTASLSKDPLKKTARRHESSELSADALPQTGSLFGELEDSMGLEPVFEPAPIQNELLDYSVKSLQIRRNGSMMQIVLKQCSFRTSMHVLM